MESVEKQEQSSEPSLWTIIKFGLFAGVLFGSGYWYSKLTTPQQNLPTKMASDAINIDQLKKNQIEYEKIQQRLKLSYYKELSAEPRKDPFVAEPSDMTKQTAMTPKLEIPAPIVAQKPEVLPEPKAPEIQEQKPSSDRLAKALEKVLGKDTPELVSSTAKIKLPTQTGSPFAVQVASLPDRKAAEELANRLNLKGYAARLVQADIAGRGLVYRVRIHGFQSRQEADEARGLLASREKLDAITVAQ